MTNSQKALVRVLQMLGFVVVVGSLVGASQIYFGPAETGLGLAVLLLVYLCRCVYVNELDRLNTLDKLNRR